MHCNMTKKYRKQLCRLQQFCTTAKKNMRIQCAGKVKYFTPDRVYKEKQLTDFERGYLAGRHSAFNDVQKEIHSMIEIAESTFYL